MNELMEKLIDKFETACYLSFDCIERENFAQAIQIACKAQRNACWREYIDMVVFRKPGDSEDYIKNAEIRKEYYE